MMVTIVQFYEGLKSMYSKLHRNYYTQCKMQSI
jgi:hypothetical protein